MKEFFLLIALLTIFQFSQAQNFKYGKVSKDELEQKAHPDYPEAEAAILYRELRSKVDYHKEDGWIMYTEVHERIKLYNEKGYEWATRELILKNSSTSDREQLSSLKGSTYVLKNGKVEEFKLKKDGIFEESVSKFRDITKFTMPSISGGCIIEYTYKIRSPFIASMEPYRFQESIPVNKVNLRFEAPEYFNYQIHQRGWIPFKIVNEQISRSTTEHFTSQHNTGVGGTYNRAGATKTTYQANISTVELNKVPPLKEETYAGNIDNYAAALHYELTFVRWESGSVQEFSTNWESVCKQIYKDEDFGNQLDRSNYFKDDLDDLLVGAKDDTDKLQRIYGFVTNKMNWNKYVGYYSDEDVISAYKQGIGNSADINLMLTAMFRYAGFNANPVLISTVSNGIPLLPSLSGFNYVVAGVETPEDIILFDGTNKLGQEDVLYDFLLNWQGRIVREDGSSEWVPLQSHSPSSTARMIDYKLSDNGWITGTVKNQRNGSSALKQRTQFVDLSPIDAALSMDNVYPNVEIEEMEFENLEIPQQPLKQNYKFKSDGYVENINGDLYVAPLVFFAMEENPFKLDERKFPIDLNEASKDRFIVRIDIPEGYKVTSLPESVNIKLGENFMSYKYLISEKGGTLQLMSEFNVNKFLFGPDMYKDIKEFFQFIVDKEKERVVISKI